MLFWHRKSNRVSAHTHGILFLHVLSLWFPTICVFGLSGWWLRGIWHHTLIDLEHMFYIGTTARHADGTLNSTQTKSPSIGSLGMLKELCASKHLILLMPFQIYKQLSSKPVTVKDWLGKGLTSREHTSSYMTHVKDMIGLFVARELVWVIHGGNAGVVFISSACCGTSCVKDIGAAVSKFGVHITHDE